MNYKIIMCVVLIFLSPQAISSVWDEEDIMGIKLGMSIDDARKKYPNGKYFQDGNESALLIKKMTATPSKLFNGIIKYTSLNIGGSYGQVSRITYTVVAKKQNCNIVENNFIDNYAKGKMIDEKVESSGSIKKYTRTYKDKDTDRFIETHDSPSLSRYAVYAAVVSKMHILNAEAACYTDESKTNPSPTFSVVLTAKQELVKLFAKKMKPIPTPIAKKTKNPFDSTPGIAQFYNECSKESSDSICNCTSKYLRKTLDKNELKILGMLTVKSKALKSRSGIAKLAVELGMTVDQFGKSTKKVGQQMQAGYMGCS